MDQRLLSSHRVLSTATNLGDSNFGPATGKKINFRTVIDCATTNNRIHEEWLVRDNLWIVTQLGLNPREVAKQMALNSKKQKSMRCSPHMVYVNPWKTVYAGKIYSEKMALLVR